MIAGAIQPWLLQPPDVLLPDDLRSWMDRHDLVRLVLEAIQTASLPVVPPARTRDGNGEFQSHIWLGVLTYCYAAVVYASADIELEFIRDPVVRHLCADTYPEAGKLRLFRRRNRMEIQRCLAEVLRRAWQVREGFECENVDEPAHPFASPESQAIREGLLPFADEAEERINRAVRLDCWALDD
jgi:hypothetical protein